MKNQRSNRAFTLIELLVVIAIIAILAGMLLPVLGTVKEKANRNNCMGQLRQIAMACKAYANDDLQDQYFPWRATQQQSNTLFKATLIDNKYIEDVKIFRCPSHKGLNAVTVGDLPIRTNSYSIIYAASDTNRIKDDGGTDTPILADSQDPNNRPHGDAGQNIFYADGHGAWRPGGGKAALNTTNFPNTNLPGGRAWLDPWF